MRNWIMRGAITGILLGTACMQPVLAQVPPSYQSAGEATAPIADAYMRAYTGLDWDALEALLAEDANFKDETATLVFGDITSDGREQMMQRFRDGYTNVTHMELDVARRIVSGDIAIFEGTLNWGLRLDDDTIVESATPMVLIITVQDGKVIRHRDYIDYAPFLSGMEKAQAG